MRSQRVTTLYTHMSYQKLRIQSNSNDIRRLDYQHRHLFPAFMRAKYGFTSDSRRRAILENCDYKLERIEIDHKILSCQL